MVDQFTPTQQRIVDLLSDGLPHTKRELFECLVDELGSINNIWPHLTAIRKKLRPRGHDILCEIYNRKCHYRHVVLLRSAGDGKS